jgi:hypothetical protein
MFKTMVTGYAAICLVLGAACLTGDDPILYVVVNSPVADTTSDAQVGIGGEVHRSPQLEAAILVVTVTGGAITVVDTANLHGLFTLTVPLTTNAENHLSLTAQDNTGASSVGPWEKTVVHIDPPSAPPASGR